MEISKYKCIKIVLKNSVILVEQIYFSEIFLSFILQRL